VAAVPQRRYSFGEEVANDEEVDEERRFEKPLPKRKGKDEIEGGGEGSKMW